jgi:hypothetical protein
MPRKGIKQKHTAKEIAGKIQAAKNANGAAGGGGAMAAARKDAGFKASISCDVCKALQPSMASMKQHYEAKHPKTPWTPEMEADYKARQAAARDSAKPKLVDTHIGPVLVSCWQSGGATALVTGIEPTNAAQLFFFVRANRFVFLPLV